jgi:hypothetical protein
MGIGAKMPNGTKVKDGDGRTGATQEFLANLGSAGGYRVKWDDDSSETEMLLHKLDPLNGPVTETAYQAALRSVVDRLGGYAEKTEALWKGTGQGYLVVCKPAHLNPGEELHAHLDQHRTILRAHVKSGQSYLRTLVDDKARIATRADDLRWLADYGLRRNMISAKRAYMDGKEPLPA